MTGAEDAQVREAKVAALVTALEKSKEVFRLISSNPKKFERAMRSAESRIRTLEDELTSEEQLVAYARFRGY